MGIYLFIVVWLKRVFSREGLKKQSAYTWLIQINIKSMLIGQSYLKDIKQNWLSFKYEVGG